MLRTLAVLMLVVCAVPAFGAETLVCESNKFERRQCPTRQPVARAQLVKQLSKAECAFGQTWGFDDVGVWAAEGCRAEIAVTFREAGVAAQGPVELVCESRERRRTGCDVGMEIGQVRLLEQLSRSDCREGTHWGHDGYQLWVDGGCRGRFRVWPAAAYVQCESVDGKYVACPLEGLVASIKVDKLLSRTRCAEEQNFGVHRGTLWVDSGCRAVFEVRYDDGRPKTQGTQGQGASGQGGQPPAQSWTNPDKSAAEPRRSPFPWNNPDRR